MATNRNRSLGCFGAIILLAVGSVFAAVGFFFLLKPEWETQHRFAAGECTVLEEQIVEGTSRGKKGRTKTTYRPEFHIRHEVGGQSYEARTFRITQSTSSNRSSSQKTLDRFEVGRRYPCWYDPANPGRVVLERGYSFGGILFAGIGLLVAGIGGVALLWRVLRVAVVAAAVKGG